MTFKTNNKFSELLYQQRHECRAKRQSIRKYSILELEQELLLHYDSFKKYLPRLNNILDIGCGLGYIDIILHRNHPNAQLFLLDSMSSFEVKVNKFYNNLELTKEFLILNEVPNNQINLIDASTTGSNMFINQNPDILKELPKMDLVISCYAWGWHSRISKYIEEVSNQMNTGGVLVLDCKGSSSTPKCQFEIDKIKEHGFSILDMIDTKGKYVVVALKD